MFSLPAYAKKIAAFFILGMFLFIQAEKLLHRHTLNIHANHEQVQCLKSSNSGCSICEFQLARDAQLPAISSVVSNNYVHSITFSIQLSEYSFLHATLIPNRGPPASIS